MKLFNLGGKNMNIKKISVSLLTAALLVGCGSGKSSAANTKKDANGRVLPADTGKKDIDSLKFQFVPSRPTDQIIKATSNLGNLFKAKMKEKGYNIARRTIAKYREQMNIPVARLRKEL